MEAKYWHWNLPGGLLHAFEVFKESLFIETHTWTIRFNVAYIPNFQIGFRHYVVPHYIYVCLGPTIRFYKCLGNKPAYNTGHYQGSRR